MAFSYGELYLDTFVQIFPAGLEILSCQKAATQQTNTEETHDK